MIQYLFKFSNENIDNKNDTMLYENTRQCGEDDFLNKPGTFVDHLHL